MQLFSAASASPTVVPSASQAALQATLIDSAVSSDISVLLGITLQGQAWVRSDHARLCLARLDSLAMATQRPTVPLLELLAKCTSFVDEIPGWFECKRCGRHFKAGTFHPEDLCAKLSRKKVYAPRVCANMSH